MAGDGDREFHKRMVILTGPGNYLAWRRFIELHALHKRYARMLTTRPKSLHLEPAEELEDLDEEDEETDLARRLRESTFFTPMRGQSVSTQGLETDDERRQRIKQAKKERELREKEVNLNADALYYMTCTLSPSISNATRSFKTAYDLWQFCYMTYGQASAASIDGLMRQLHTKTFLTPTVVRVFSWIADISDQLRDAGKPVAEDDEIREALRIMSGSRNQEMRWKIELIRHEIALGTQDWTLVKIREHLLNWEIREGGVRQYEDSRGVRSGGKREAALQSAKSEGAPKTNQESGSGKYKKGGFRLKCYNCQKIGHKAADCRGPKGLKAYHHGEAEASESENEEVVALNATLGERNRSAGWFHDSGASFHMTGSKEDFKTFARRKEKVVITGIKKVQVVAEWGGEVEVKVWKNGKPTATLTLENVLYIPGLGVRLFSAGAAADNGLVSVIRTTGTTVVKASNEKEVVFVCPKSTTHSRLYACPFTSVSATKYTPNLSLCGYLPVGTVIQSTVTAVSPPTQQPAATSQQTQSPATVEQPQPTEPEEAAPTEPEEAAQPEQLPTTTQQPQPFVSNHPWDRYPKVKAPYDVWHSRLGHISRDRLQRLVQQKMVLGMEVVGGPKKEKCEGCVVGKSTKQPEAVGGRTRGTRPHQLYHVDLCEFSNPAICKAQYVLNMVDDYSGYTYGFLMSKKSGVPTAVQAHLAMVKQKFPGARIEVFRADGGGEFTSAEMRKLLQSEGIELQTSAPYKHEHNGVVERRHRTINDTARTILHSSGVSKGHWPEAVKTAIYLNNRLPYHGTDGERTPFEAMFGKKPDVSHLRAFGTKVHAVIPNELRTNKMGPRTEVGQLVGYSTESKAYRILFPNGAIKERADVVFFEETPAEVSGIKRKFSREEDEPTLSPVKKKVQGEGSSKESTMEPGPNKYPPRQTRSGTTFSKQQHEGGGKVHPKEVAELQEKVGESATLALVSTMEADTSEGLVNEATGDTPTYQKHEVPIPRNYQQAVKGPFKAQWVEAMDREYQSLLKHNVATPVARPKGINVIDTMWVLTVKVNSNNEVIAFKARNVAKGYTQVPGADYWATFSPTSIPQTVRYITAHAAAHRRELFQCDVATAYLNAPLQEELYIEPPEGYRTSPDVVWKLNKCLYGLKQSAREWHLTLTKALATIGFSKKSSDPCLYTRPSKGHKDDIDIITVHVDDIRGSAPSKVAAEAVITDIKTLFDIKVNGATEAFLGIETELSRDGSIKIHQAAYARRMLQRFGMADCNPLSLPMTKDPLSKKQCPEEKEVRTKEEKSRITLYRAMVGSLNYLAVWTRPDISYAVSQLARFNDNPGQAHHEAAKRVLRYIQGTIDKGITYPAGISQSSIADSTGISNGEFSVSQHQRGGKEQKVNKTLSDTTEVFADADYASNPDTRKSTTGVYVCVNGRAVFWYSKSQPVVATSSTEAEYIAISQATKEALWMRKLQSDLKDEPRRPTAIYEDNQGCIRLTANPEAFARTKHIDVRFHMVRDYVDQQLVEVRYVGTKNQVADMMTKALSKEDLQRCLRVVG